MTRRISVTIGVVLVLAMLASVGSAQAYPSPGTSVTNIVVQNTSTTVGDTAHLTVQYYDTDGNLDHTNSSVTIEPKAVQEIKTQDETVLGDGWQGSAVMSSDITVAAIVSIKNTGVPGADDGYTQGAYNGSLQGAETLYFPSVYGFSGIVSRLTVQNTEGSEATVYVSYYKRDGASMGTKTDTIPAYSQKTYYLGDADDLPFDPDDFVDGSAVVTSANKLAGAAVTTWANRSGAYQALTDSNKGTTLYAPSHYRFKASPSDTKYGLFSALNVQNTSATATANVTATYYTRGDVSGTPALTMIFTIAPLSAKGLNTKTGGDFDASEFEDLSKAGGGVADWDGSVKIVSDQQLVAVCNTVWDQAAKAGVYAMVTEDDGAESLFVPAQYRREVSWGWAQWSALNLMNVGSSTIGASDLTIQYIDTDGNAVVSFSSSDLPGDLAPGAAVGLNTRNGGDLDEGDFTPLGTNFIGGVYVTGPSGSKLVGVANIIYNNRASVYNTFPEP